MVIVFPESLFKVILTVLVPFFVKMLFGDWMPAVGAKLFAFCGEMVKTTGVEPPASVAWLPPATLKLKLKVSSFSSMLSPSRTTVCVILVRVTAVVYAGIVSELVTDE